MNIFQLAEEMSVNQGRDGDEDEQATNGYSH
jgi:hypothetical protein